MNDTPSQGIEGRHAARFGAVQAIYQMELTGIDSDAVITEFIEHRFTTESEYRAGPAPDEAFFASIVQGIPRHQVEIDRAIADSLAENWKLQRIDSILRAILRAGAFELIERKDVPGKVVINEYVDLAHAFFEKDEPTFVNAVLDRLARRKRAEEFGLPKPDDELHF